MCDLLDAITSAIKCSPSAHIPADHSRSRDVIQKKLMDCPISSHEPGCKGKRTEIYAKDNSNVPVSCTWKKKVSVIPSVSVRATSSSEKGGSWSVLFRTANVTDNII